MEQERLYNCVEQPGSLDKITVEEFGQMIEEFPYFQTVRLLYTQNLHATGDPRYNDELGKTAIFCADRSKLFYLIHAERYAQLLNMPGSDALSEKDRTEILLNSYLQSFEEKVKDDAPPVTLGEEHAASVDYFAYLEAVGEGISLEGREQHRLQHQDIIDAFIEKANNDNIRPSLPAERSETSKGEPEEGEGEFLTETLAKIYIKQQKYEQALAIIKRISLNFPKKSAYFADQIRFLEYLIINEKNKK
ncbi:MAG: tetratricopeptide repeat protein [Bacteroidota bacterium]|nr:tetratricopeptide repeat protein [Bacteroidota bacterium]